MESLTNLNQNTNHPEWNESYYFVFYDKEQNLGGTTRLGFKPNKQEGMTFFFLFLPDGSAAGYNLVRKVEDYRKSLQVGGIIHNCKNQSQWNYRFQGNMIVVRNPEDLPLVRRNPKLIAKTINVTLNIEFKAISQVYEYSEHMTPESLEIGKKAGDKHWEQIANVTGNVKIDNTNFPIKNSIGQRDHTYGVRDWTGVGNWLYYVVWFDNNLAINPAAVITEDGRLSIGGFLFKDGKNIPLVDIEIVDQQFREDGVLPVSSELKLRDSHGNSHLLKANVGPIIPIPFIDNDGNQSILVQSIGKFELDGITGGYGTFETLRRVRR
jgi:hypothetical protein